MEGEKKRKREESSEIHAIGGRRKEGKETEREVEVEVGGVSTPTEEEVEEFVAILRRMHVAVKYFEKSNGYNGRKLSEVLRSLRTVSVTEELSRSDGVKVGEEGVHCVLDLNAVPDGESSSDVC